VLAVALPSALRPASMPAGAGADALLAQASGQPIASLGPHGDDTTSAIDRETDPPIDRSVAPTGPPDPSQLTGYRWPISHAFISNGFGKGYPGGFVIDGVTAHDGIDVANFCGSRITAAHDGTVLSAGRHHEGYVGWIGDLTPYREKLDAAGAWRTRAIAVVIDDGNGYRSVYVHLSKVNVHAGDVVKAGDLIGWEGQTGNATGCHLHYAIFSPAETDSWLLEPKARERSLLPDREIARIDPLLVLPPLADAGIVWAWGVRQED
jgi:murein DD-endopeptidase MepM/ murein hydrolase activator NlpD